MMVILILALVIVVGVVVAVIVGRVGSDAMAGPDRTSPFELPDGHLGTRDIEKLRFDQALRGYNMAQVDAVLDRLYEELRAIEQEHDGHAPHAPQTRETNTLTRVRDQADGASPAHDATQVPRADDARRHDTPDTHEGHGPNASEDARPNASIVPFRSRRRRDPHADDQ